MLIICTKDPDIRASGGSASAAAWGQVCQLPIGNFGPAHTAFATHLRSLRDQEDLCITAHGNDEEIGDADNGWGWTADQIASLLKKSKSSFRGNILVSACGENISNFSTRLALALERDGLANGSWVFGYSRETSVEGAYPKPADLLSRSVRHADLQCARVGGGRTRSGR